MIDAHVSFQEPYSYELLNEYAKTALHKGLSEITVLEPTYKFNECSQLYKEIRVTYPCQQEWYDGIIKISIKEYQEFILKMRKKEFPVKIKFGLEVSYFTQHEQFIRQLLQAFPYDVNVGSIQFVDNIAFAWLEHSNEMMWGKYNAAFLYRRYYEMMNAMVTSSIFEGISGFDNIKIMGINPRFKLNHTYHKLAKKLKEHHTYVEDDTSIHYRYNHPDNGLSEDFLCIAQEEGVEIKVSSHAQCVKEIAKNFK